MCSRGLTAEEGCCFLKYESYDPKLEGDCYGISNPAFFSFLSFQFRRHLFFFKHVSLLRLQNSWQSFRPVLSPAPGEELCMAASAKSQLQKVIQGQIPPCSELPSTPQWGLMSVQHLAGVTPCLQCCITCKPHCVQLLSNFTDHVLLELLDTGTWGALIKLQEGRNVRLQSWKTCFASLPWGLILTPLCSGA